MTEQLATLVHLMHQQGIGYEAAVREFKKQYIYGVLAVHRGNQCRAARELNMHRNTLSRILSELEIDVRQVRSASRRPPRRVENAAMPERKASNQ